MNKLILGVVLKVLHVYKTYFPDSIGGVEQVINQIARSTRALGVSTQVLSLTNQKDSPEVRVDDHDVIRCKVDFEIASTPFSWSAISKFKHLAESADIIHYHYPYPYADLLHFLASLRKPSLVTYHSDIIKQKQLLRLYRPLQHRFLNDVGKIVATSPNYLKSSPVLAGYSDSTVVIPIGLDRSTYAESRADRLEYWRHKFGDRFFLFVGVIRYYKGLHILIDAAEGQPYPVVIVGAGPVERELKQRVDRMGLTNVHFLGLLPEEDKVALLELSFAVVFPSHLRSEAFGVSLLEGAMFGKPLISSEIGTGTTFINVDQVTGLVVEPGDTISLRSAMDYLWHNQSAAKKMGRQAEARYWELFTAKRMADSYFELYKKLRDGFDSN